MTSKWSYGGAFERHPIDEQIVRFADGSVVQPRNIFDELPSFMLAADLLFIDPPWNQGNINSFYTKAGRADRAVDFTLFISRLFDCIGEIDPATCYIEVGKEYLADFIIKMRGIYKNVTFYNSSYYHRADNFCYVVRGSSKRKKLPLDGMDEEDIIKWVCVNEQYDTIGDLCMGRGLVGLHAFAAGKRFVGTELNHKRLAVLVGKLYEKGLNYSLTPV